MVDFTNPPVSALLEQLKSLLTMALHKLEQQDWLMKCWLCEHYVLQNKQEIMQPIKKLTALFYGFPF